MLLRSLSDVKRQFPIGAVLRGERYFFENRVRLERIDEDGAEAVVRGTRPYRVGLQIDEQAEELEASCTCPAFFDEGVCKHIWATILAVNAVAGADDDDSIDDEPWVASVGDPRPRGGDRGKEWSRPLGELRALGAGRVDPDQAGLLRLSFVLWPPGSTAQTTVTVEVFSQRKHKRGGWSEPRLFAHCNPGDLHKLSEGDRRCLALLHGGHDGMWGYGRGSRFEVQPELQSILLPRVARESRLLLRLRGDKTEIPIAADAGGRWDFGVVLARRDPTGPTSLEGILVRAGERMGLAETDVLLSGGLFVAQERLREVDWRGAWGVAQVLRRSGTIEVPSARRRELLEILSRLPGEPLIDAPDTVRSIQEPSLPRLVLSEPEVLGDARARIHGRVEFQYGPYRMQSRTPDRLQIDGDALVRIARDRQAERAALERLATLGGQLDAADGAHDVVIPSRALPGLVHTLTAEGWQVEADGRLFRTSGAFRLSVRSGIDWFDLEGGADFGEASAALPELLKAIRSGTRLVRLSDGSYGLLPEEWLAGWGLAAFATVEGSALRFPKSQAWFLDALIAERGATDVDAAFEKARAALRRIDGFRPAAAPEGFRGELRGYQREGLGWLRTLRELGLGGCLADDMGLGKTVQVLALLCEPAKMRRPALVVAPRSVVFNWQREAERFAPDLSVLVHHGPGRSSDAGRIARHGLVVTTYGTLVRDAELLARIRFGHAVLDEAQAIKNAESQSAKAARLLSAENRLVLTGTPVENHLDDLWSLFEFLNPGMLGRSRVFKSLLESRSGDAVEFRPLAKALRPFLLRRTKEQVLADLPPKVEQVIACDLEGAERRRYEDLRDHYRASLLARADGQGLERIQMHVLSALLRLRQAACHPGLLDPAHSSAGSAKLDALLPMLEEVRESGHKALVFSQFTSFLAVVRARLDALGCPYEYLDGRTRRREDKVRRFQENPTCPFFLISLKAGGFGLNLTAADYVFLLDPWWNPAVERQAIDRAHRIGQTRPVNAYKLVARGTIEEKVLELQERKRELADSILGEAEGSLRDLTREDLEKLLS